MYASFYLLIGSLFYLVVVTFLYFNSKRKQTLEIKVYKYMLTAVFLGIFIDFIKLYISNKVINPDMSMVVISYLYSVFLLTIICLTTLYVFLPSTKKFTNKTPKWVYLIGGVYLLSIIINFVFEIYEINFYFLYLVIGISIFSWFLYILINFQNIKKKKYMPIIIFILLFPLVIYIQSVNPDLLITTVFISSIIIFIYLTFENVNIELINELEIAKEQVDKANFNKAEFLSEMSHQIRTPLNAIVGYSQCIEEHDLSDDIMEDVQNIKKASNNLLELINNIVDISKMSLNQLEIINDKYEVGKLLDEVVTITKDRIGNKQLEFRTDFNDNLPKFLYGDYNRLKKVIINVLTNAVNCTEKGYIDFKIDAIKNDEMYRLTIVIENTGVIFPNDEIDSMFKKYSHLNTDKFQSMEETNINLAMTRRLVELMKGSIIVTDETGIRSCVTVTINQKAINDTITNNLENTIHLDLSALNVADKRVLLVDDNKINLKVASKLLANYGLQTDEVFSGQECLDKINSGEQYDLILLDDMMPNMSGVETLNKLKKIKRFNTPVIALTANATIGMKEKYLKDGFDEFIPKPIEKKELNTILVKFLKLKNTNITANSPTTINLDLLASNGIDVEKGIELLGDIETYNEMLKDFLSEAQKKIIKLNAYREANDMENYAILAHSFKTDAKYFGFTKLIDISYNHEIESKNKNIEYINNNYRELDNELNRILTILRKYLG